MANKKKSPIDDYESFRPKVESLANKVKELIADIAEGHDINPHAIEARAKTPESLQKKINKPGKAYNEPLKEVTDLCGVRAILYYQEDVETLCEAIRKEFKINEQHSIDKRKELKTDQFGYISNHIVCKIDHKRQNLVEWKKYKDIYIEIQVRTVLQHAWASISHTQAYKSEKETPPNIARQLSRVAGLLELADEQFSSLREKTNSFLGDVQSNIEKNNLNLPINAISILEFLDKSKVVKTIISTVESSGLNIDLEDEDIEQVATVCECLQITSLSEIEHRLESLRGSYKYFFDEFANLNEQDDVERQHVSGGRDHWCAVAIAAASYKDPHLPDLLEEDIWSEGYFGYIIDSLKKIGINPIQKRDVH
ncbi:PpGpp synthetase catalytic domain-containing protein (RelA/SpoT-type nucleotidyltranferase) [Ectopseudomonas oleovorans]|uniref:PpGpp synthetase catalytic domain-containing protein (RelA/SpoT-type nucleotidyltranferase) n=1 Tax=Ectopseudomonas oleovorans TaxID=301 RepID=A0A653B7Q3_ECTOL|nr:PpGpp synthetase catalytic domain-containing protein (RelA/SpoT-type nucleotidyltranferase) [Pseudomonas oleovorans]